MEGDTCYQMEVGAHEYRNLMVLINDRVCPENFGECGGQGRCATCLVRIEGGADALRKERYRNEKSTMQRKGINEVDARLSCQVMIDFLLEGATIYIEP